MRAFSRTIILSCAALLTSSLAHAVTFSVTVTETADGVSAVGEGAFDTNQLTFSLNVASPPSAVVGTFN
ncbi:MAG: hypothetical protein AAGG47_16030 [Pseudomonadota bacterium]